RGREATLEMVDAVTGSWGHINVDDIVFMSNPLPGVRRPLATVAQQFKLDAEQAGRRVKLLAAVSADDRALPLHAWTALTMEPPGVVASANHVPAATSTQVFAAFDGDDFEGWRIAGAAFGEAPTQARWHPQAQTVRLLPPGVAHSGATAHRLQ